MVKVILLLAVPLFAFMLSTQRASADTYSWSQLSGSPNTHWIGIASSTDGQYLAGVSVQISGYIFTSNDHGATWNQIPAPSIAGDSSWSSIAESPDGQTIMLGESNGYLWGSSDRGADWRINGGSAPSADWTSVTLGGTSGYYAAAIDATNHTVWTAQETGEGIWSWIESNPDSENWVSVAYSPDATSLIAGSSSTPGGYLAVSTNQAGSWSAGLGGVANDWNAVAAGNSGKLVAAGGYNNIYTSTDSGSTWQSTGESGSGVTGISESADGSVIAAAPAGGGYIHVSSNGGTSWTDESVPSYANWDGITVSGDGSQVIAAAGYQNLWINSGGATAPSAPTDISLVTADGYLNGTLTWSAPASTGGETVNDYLVEVKKHGDTWNNYFFYDDVPATNPLTDSINFPAYGDYDVRVLARNNAGSSDYGTATYSTVAAVVQDISSCEQFDAIAADPSSGYADTYDIAGSFSCEGLDFQPIHWGEAFSGTLNGQGNTISDITINQPETTDVGPFGYANGGTIENVTLTNESVVGQNDVGGIAGEIDNEDLSSVTVDGALSDTGSTTGGIGGAMDYYDGHNHTVSGITTDVAITGTSQSYGGFAGWFEENGPDSTVMIINANTSGSITPAEGQTSDYIFGPDGVWRHI